jgi:uncharacterized membrane protein YfcA
MASAEFFLIFISFFTSATTAAFGVGGGALLLVIMASFYPPSILIPVHGFIQLGSNVGRGILMYKDIAWKTGLLYMLGTAIGVALGMEIFINLSERVLSFILASAILLFTWLPVKEVVKKAKSKIVFAGAFAGFLTLFIGATGILTAAFLARNKKFSKYNKVATFAVCMTAQHLFKVFAFGLMGFAFAPYALFILCMVATGFLGTYVGKKYFLDKVSDHKFEKVFKVIVTLLALKIIVQLFI